MGNILKKFGDTKDGAGATLELHKDESFIYKEYFYDLSKHYYNLQWNMLENSTLKIKGKYYWNKDNNSIKLIANSLEIEDKGKRISKEKENDIFYRLNKEIETSNFTKDSTTINCWIGIWHADLLVNISSEGDLTVGEVRKMKNSTLLEGDLTTNEDINMVNSKIQEK